MARSRNFYFIRHGETDWNSLYKKLQGHTDIELNAVGYQQAQALSSFSRELNFTRVITSDLQRASKTAEHLNLPTEKSALLREINLGEAEGKTWAELEQIYHPEFRKLWSMNLAANLDQRFPGGESRREVTHRILSCIQESLSKYSEDNLVFVSHGFAIRSLIYHLTEIEGPFFVPNCAIVPFRESFGELIYCGPDNPELLPRPILKT